jgi:hypothetical protein
VAAFESFMKKIEKKNMMKLKIALIFTVLNQ